MHGIIHVELKKFVELKFGATAWIKILEEAGYARKNYLSISVYPDEETVALAGAAAKVAGLKLEVALEAFGKYLAPELIKMYKAYVHAEWKTIELLLNTEDTIHKVVRSKNPGAAPPMLNFERTGDRQLKFHYNSPRKMSAVAKGMISGVADYYNEKILIQEKKKPDGSVEMTIIVM